jgi:hypothetical protein
MPVAGSGAGPPARPRLRGYRSICAMSGPPAVGHRPPSSNRCSPDARASIPIWPSSWASCQADGYSSFGPSCETASGQPGGTLAPNALTLQIDQPSCFYKRAQGQAECPERGVEVPRTSQILRRVS